jgi:hypothetical protein
LEAEKMGIVSAREHQQRIKESDEALERLRAERDDLDYRIERWEVQRGKCREAAALAGVAEAGLKRSKMTAAEKSRIIGEHGSEAYFAIPWD